jgi:hypothetical protein
LRNVQATTMLVILTLIAASQFSSAPSIELTSANQQITVQGEISQTSTPTPTPTLMPTPTPTSTPPPTPTLTPNPTSPPTSPNLAVIPDDWRWGRCNANPAEPFGDYVFVDYAVTHNGHPSLRLQKGGGIDDFNVTNRAAWTNEPFGVAVKPGDHIIFRAWLRTDTSSTGNTIHGARIGVDLWVSNRIVGGYPDMFLTGPLEDSEYVHWGTSEWTMREYDFVVPYTIFNKTETGDPITPGQANMIDVWVQAIPALDNGNIWISDAELYINP